MSRYDYSARPSETLLPLWLPEADAGHLITTVTGEQLALKVRGGGAWPELAQ
jgi:hypothetical protein